jgi:hypothetical protein
MEESIHHGGGNMQARYTECVVPRVINLNWHGRSQNMYREVGFIILALRRNKTCTEAPSLFDMALRTMAQFDPEAASFHADAILAQDHGNRFITFDISRTAETVRHQRRSFRLSLPGLQAHQAYKSVEARRNGFHHRMRAIYVLQLLM